MPNGVVVGVNRGAFGRWVEPGDRARLHPGGMDAGALHVRWPWPAPAWEPRVAGGPWPRDRVLERGEAILRHLGADAVDPSRALLGALERRDAASVRAAADSMLGLGPGLTPEGDDVLAAAAVTVVALGSSVGLDERARHVSCGR